MKKLQNSKGMSDRLFETCIIRQSIEKSIHCSMESWGCSRIDTPVIEYVDVFPEEFMKEEASVYKLIDRDGSVVALRPDITIPCSRVVSTKLKDFPLPLKVYYSGNVYRIDPNNLDGQRELPQIGAEIYGEGSVWEDAEAIALACRSLSAAGLKDFKLDIGHSGIFGGLCKLMGLSSDISTTIRQLITDRNLVELDAALEGLAMVKGHKKLLTELPGMFGKPEFIFSRTDALCLNKELIESLDYLKQLYEGLKAFGVKEYINIDLGLLGGLYYYTGIIFKGYARGASSKLISGGRYDSLTERFGYSCGAVGFALYLDQIQSALMEQEGYCVESDKALVLYTAVRAYEAYKYAEELRSIGIAASLANREGVKDVEKYMQEYGFARLKSFD